MIGTGCSMKTNIGIPARLLVDEHLAPHPNRGLDAVNCRARALLAVLAALCLASCAIAPASVHRVVRRMTTGDAGLHDLMDKALASPADDEKASAALARFVEAWKLKGRAPRGDLAPTSVGGITYHVRFGGTQTGTYSLNYFDEITPACDFKIGKIEHRKRAGVGAPLVALRENRHCEPIEAWYPPEAIARPLTAVVSAGSVHGGMREVRIDLLCPMVNDSVRIEGRKRPLAADFSVPWAAALSRAGKLNQARVLDMLTRTPGRKPQLYLMEPYDPRKEPLIMIHGLLSTPLAWASLSNELWADDQIRERYQIWHYLYNTAAPPLYATRLLRAQLHDLRMQLDPTGRDPAMRRTTLLTHSMGGLVGKGLVVRPGDAFWKAAFKVPHESLHLSPEDRAQLNDAFEWQPDLTIHRIIFVSVPHRGSAFADNFLGYIGGLITVPPQTFRAFYTRITAANPGVFTPAYEMLGTGRLDSVHSLSPRQPTLQILASLPLPRGVQVHSIIGNRGKPGPLDQSSDGVVPYTSSHIDCAASEVVVPASHSALRHPKTVAEIKRILKLP